MEKIPANSDRFVIQEHHASRLHYDFRLEMTADFETSAKRGEVLVLKSWAVPKNISAEVGIKRLAIQVEDHEANYIDFEGTIEEGSYGAGKVTIWDNGIYSLVDKKRNENGEIKEIIFDLHGKKLEGQFALVKTKGYGSGKGKENTWLIFRKK